MILRDAYITNIKNATSGSVNEASRSIIDDSSVVPQIVASLL